MTGVWQLSAVLALLAVGELIAVLSAVAADGVAVLWTHWPFVLWLSMPPAGVVAAVWLSRGGGRVARATTGLAAAAVCVPLTLYLLDIAEWYGWLRTGWQPMRSVEAPQAMRVPAVLAAVAVASGAFGRLYRPNRAADEDAE